MTNPRYPIEACADGSQVRGDASPSYAWCVGFNNGNVNNNHRDNDNRVRAVRGPVREFPGAPGAQVTLRALYDAWIRARRQKVPSANQLTFDTAWADRLIELHDEINAGRWSPRPSTCFIATRPKAREIHAPDFADRVVHHWLVPQLEAIYEPVFVHDSFGNRVGKGCHAAVQRLQQFVRAVHSGQGGGWYLQLDVANYFNRIHRPTLYALLKRRMERAGLPPITRQVVHALLRRPARDAGIVVRATAAELAQVPLHKRLDNAPAGCGLPIGNLSSQFFALVYLNELDQFVKHTLRVPRYVRYVDDFVLVHRDRAQLEQWRDAIERFLHERLRLDLKAEQRLQPLTEGIDFLGYVVRPTHTTIRRRVVSHARAALAAWETAHVAGGAIRATPEQYRAIRSTWASYRGHFEHAAAHRLQQGIIQRFAWLPAAIAPRRFALKHEGRRIRIRLPTR